MIPSAPQTIDDISRIILQLDIAKSFTFRVAAALGREYGKIICRSSEIEYLLEYFADVGETICNYVVEACRNMNFCFVINLSSHERNQGKEMILMILMIGQCIDS